MFWSAFHKYQLLDNIIDLRHTVTQSFCRNCCSIGCIENDLNLHVCKLWLHKRSCFSELYLHGAFIDQHSVELNESVVGAACFAEDDGCNAAAHTIGSVGEHGSLDRPNRFAEILL